MRTARARVSGKSGDLSLDNVISFQKMVSYSPEKVKYGDFAIGTRSFHSQPHLDRWPIFAGLSGFLAKETADGETTPIGNQSFGEKVALQ